MHTTMKQASSHENRGHNTPWLAFEMEISLQDLFQLMRGVDSKEKWCEESSSCLSLKVHSPQHKPKRDRTNCCQRRASVDPS